GPGFPAAFPTAGTGAAAVAGIAWPGAEDSCGRTTVAVAPRARRPATTTAGAGRSDLDGFHIGVASRDAQVINRRGCVPRQCNNARGRHKSFLFGGFTFSEARVIQ